MDFDALVAAFSPEVSQAEIDALESEIKRGSEQVDVRVSVPTDVAKKILKLLTFERHGGSVVLSGKTEYSPFEAASILGISRQTVVRGIEAGFLEARKVGSHWRIPAEEIVAYQQREKKKQKAAAERLARLTLDTADESYQLNRELALQR